MSRMCTTKRELVRTADFLSADRKRPRPEEIRVQKLDVYFAKRRKRFLSFVEFEFGLGRKSTP